MAISIRTHGVSSLAAAAAIAALALTLTGTARAVDASAVSTLVGTWGGSGRITYTDGTSENIRCTAYNSGGGSELRMAIQCKSDKNPVNIRSRLRIDGGRASGDWEERTFNASGTASGSAGAGSLSLGITGSGFSGSMSVSFSKSSLNVNISTSGIALRRAAMSFSRR